MRVACPVACTVRTPQDSLALLVDPERFSPPLWRPAARRLAMRTFRVLPPPGPARTDRLATCLDRVRKSEGITMAEQAETDDPLQELLRLRSSIDNLDAALVHLLAERFRCTQQVGRLKAAHHLPPADPAREASQIERLRRLAGEAHLDPAFAEKFLNFIIEEVVRHHKAIARGTATPS
jgi:chorismate mutase